ncbi:MAG: FeoA family protein [Elusimicrobiota bacterium]
MTLDDIGLDVPVRITGFVSMDASERGRLSGLGVRAGATITKLIPTPLQDPVECLVGPQLLALERRLLERILVEPL